MELNSAVSGAAQTASITSADRVPRASGPSRSGLLSSVQRVSGVVVTLSPQAEAMLERSSGQGEGPAVDLAGNPLSGGVLADVMIDAQERLFGDEVEAIENGAFNIYDNEAQSEAAQQRRSGVQSAPVEAASSPESPDGLSSEERAMVDQLKARDRAVRSHEMAHVGAAGGLAGAPVFSYQTGPDGKRYAIGGHVSIDTSPGRTHEETIAKAQRIRSAALAPADPSAADRAVASRASQMESQARAAMSRAQAREAREALESAAEAASGQSQALSLPELPAVDLDPLASPPELGDLESPEPVRARPPRLVQPPSLPDGVVAGGSVSTLASPAISSFGSGLAGELQVVAPTEADMASAYLAASRLQSPDRNPALLLARVF